MSVPDLCHNLMNMHYFLGSLIIYILKNNILPDSPNLNFLCMWINYQNKITLQKHVLLTPHLCYVTFFIARHLYMKLTETIIVPKMKMLNLVFKITC